MSKVSEQLDSIRMRFVGTGEEHEFLAGLIANYQAAYDKGVKDRETEIFEEARRDTDALTFAHFICSLTCEARNFITNREIWDMEETAGWLKGIGKTPEILRKLADAMEDKQRPADFTVPDLPDDLAEGFEVMRLAIIHHRADSFHAISRDDVLATLRKLTEITNG